MVQVLEITRYGSLPVVGNPVDKPVGNPVTNYLLMIILLQATTSKIADENQVEASKKKRAATFTQGLVNELKRRGGFSLETADSHKAFLDQLNKKYGAEKLGYNEALVLKQMNQMYTKLDSLKPEMQRVQKEIDSLKEEIKELEKNETHYQEKLDGYLKKYKKGGFIVPGYNAYLAAKIIEYRKKRDGAEKKITEKNGEINLKKMPELNALKAEAQRIQKGFEGNKEADAAKMIATANDELAQAKAMLDAAMSSNLLIKA